VLKSKQRCSCCSQPGKPAGTSRHQPHKHHAAALPSFLGVPKWLNNPRESRSAATVSLMLVNSLNAVNAVAKAH
jgi:hypothetical protein